MTIKHELSALPLDSPRWHELTHAYGKAGDIPALLQQLDGVAPSSSRDNPWFALSSALAHQGDVYPASFAAVPHVVRALASAPLRAHYDYFAFPAWVEICRRRNGIMVPADLRADYEAALAALPGLVALAASQEWDDAFLVSALAAVAATKGSVVVAEAVMELTPDVATEFMEWVQNR